MPQPSGAFAALLSLSERSAGHHLRVAFFCILFWGAGCIAAGDTCAGEVLSPPIPEFGGSIDGTAAGGEERWPSAGRAATHTLHPVPKANQAVLCANGGFEKQVPLGTLSRRHPQHESMPADGDFYRESSTSPASEEHLPYTLLVSTAKDTGVESWNFHDLNRDFRAANHFASSSVTYGQTRDRFYAEATRPRLLPPSRLFKERFSQPASLSVISPGGGELKESGDLFRRVLRTNILASSQPMVSQHPAGGPFAINPSAAIKQGLSLERLAAEDSLPAVQLQPLTTDAAVQIKGYSSYAPLWVIHLGNYNIPIKLGAPEHPR